MMFKCLSFTLLAATGAQALWLSASDMSLSSNVDQAFYGEPSCLVGKGDTQAEAVDQATSPINGIIIGQVQRCSELAGVHSKQLGGFWDDYGTINYEDDNWHWYCYISGTGASCDAGNGAPKKKRSLAAVEFKA